LAKIFNEIIIRHDDDIGGRTIEEVENLIIKGILNINPGIPITYSLAECEAVDDAIDHAVPDSVIVILTENSKRVTDCIPGRQQKYKELNQRWQRAV
jgi:cyanophycin synthetase